MLRQIALPNPRNENIQNLYGNELLRLQQRGELERRLTEIDRTNPTRRIYIMGCGRSGTWLLTHVFSTFKDIELVPRELPVEHFGLLVTNSVLVMKRDAAAYRRVLEIPLAIQIAYIIRHPFDVLTSHLPSSQRPFHILPDRWLGEMKALEYLTSAGRPATKIIRYEDLVTKSIGSQSALAKFFDLRVSVSIANLVTPTNNPTEGLVGVPRKLDLNSIDKHKQDPKKLEYLKKIKPELGKTLEWVAERYSYDISL